MNIRDLEEKYAHIRKAWEQGYLVEFYDVDTLKWEGWYRRDVLALDWFWASDWRVTEEKLHPIPTFE